MITKINSIHGTSSKVTFECEGIRITASGEFFAKDGKIAGVAVSKASLKFDNGEWLTAEEQEELISRYAEYVRQPHVQKKWALEFD